MRAEGRARPSRAGRGIPWALLLWATACSSGSDPGPAASALTTQVVVFDATADPFLGVLLPYVPGDVRVDTGVGGAACPPNAHVAPGGVATFDPSTAGPVGLPVRLGTSFPRAAEDPPPPDFDKLDVLEDDCGVSASFAAADAWLAAALHEADQVVADLEICVATAEMSYCEIVRRVEAAETTGHTLRRDDLEYVFGAGQQGRPLRDGSTAACSRFLGDLDEISPLLDALRFDRARCEDVVEAMQSVIDRTRVSHSASEKASRLAHADSLLHQARGLLQSGRRLATRMGQIRDRFDPEDVKASCAGCTPQAGYRRPAPAGTVRVRWQGDKLAAVTAALTEAAGNEPDPDVSAWLEGLAARLRQVPGDGVLEVSFVGQSRVGTDYVALADPITRMDETAPWVVLLAVLPAGTDHPEPNAADLRLLHEAYRSFVAALVGAP